MSPEAFAIRAFLSLLCLTLINGIVAPPWSLGLCSALLFSMVLHELGHVMTALWLGDSTAKDDGRLTLNPIAHLDFVFFEPVPVTLSKLDGGRFGRMAVMLAGPAVNFGIGLFAVLAPHGSFLWYVGMVNWVVGAFNLLPVPPLDGYKAIYYAEFVPK